MTLVGDAHSAGKGARVLQRSFRAKVVLYLSWLCAAGAVVTAGRFESVGGVLFGLSGLALLLAVKWDVVADYSERAGARGHRRARTMSAIAASIAILFVVLGGLMVAGA